MFPVEVQVSKKKTVTVAADEGIFPSTKEGWRACGPSFRTACTRSERRPTRPTAIAASA